MLRVLKYFWPLPITAVGLAMVGLTRITGGSCRLVAGTVEAWGGFSSWLIERGLRRKAWCMTVGHVIIGIDQDSLERARGHERVHVRQYEKWGVLFVPLYLGSSFLAWLQGKHCYRDNVFEQEAYRLFP